MIFSHDTEVALACAVMLINTQGTAGASDEDTLQSKDDLELFLAQWRFTGSRTYDDGELVEVQRLRPRLRAIWATSRDEAVPLINQLLHDGHASPFLARHDDWDWHLHATAPEQPLPQRMAVEAAMALADVVRTDEWSRIRVCDAEDCENVLIDLSRNRSRRYCDAGCGNRLNVAAYRARAATD